MDKDKTQQQSEVDVNQPPTLRGPGWIVVIYTNPALREKGNCIILVELQNTAAHTEEAGVHLYREWKHYSSLGKIFMEHIVEAQGGIQKERNLQRLVGDTEHACLHTGAWNQHQEECETLLQFNNLNLHYVSLPVFSSSFFIFNLSAQQTRMLLPDWQQRTVNTMGPTADSGDAMTIKKYKVITNTYY